MPDYTEASIAEIFETIAADIAMKKRESVSVVTVSWGTKRWNEQMAAGLDTLLAMKVPVICAAGNAAMKFRRGTRGRGGGRGRGKPRLVVDWFPPILESKVIVVGNSKSDGRRHPSSQVSRLSGNMLYAPGVDAVCAVEGKWTGTSFGKDSRLLVLEIS